MKIYLIGAIQKDGSSKKEFDNTADELRKRGYDVINPFDDFEVGEKLNSIEKFNKHRIKLLASADSVVLINDIARDAFSQMQKQAAGMMGIPVRVINEMKNLMKQ